MLSLAYLARRDTDALDSPVLGPAQHVLGPSRVRQRRHLRFTVWGYEEFYSSGVIVYVLGIRVSGFGFLVYRLGLRVWCLRFRVPGSVFGAQGLGFMVYGSECLVWV